MLLLNRVLRDGFDDLRGRFSARSYSQEGEDMVLRRFLNLERIGFYVDVGAHHPMKYSNTRFFYRNGWSGLNIDAMPGSMELFNRARPRDINVEAAVGNSTKTLSYYVFNEPALNTFDAALAAERATGTYRVVRTVDLAVRPLREILEQYLPGGCGITFLSVDVEGLDLDVLQSNDWVRFRPEYVVAELSEPTMERILESELVQFMARQGYSLVAKTFLSVIFKDVSQR